MLISFRAVVTGHVVVACLFYFMGWAECQSSLFSPSSAIASNSEDLKTALDIQAVTQIYLLNSIEFDNATGTLPLHVPPHNGRVTLTGLVPPTLVGQSSEFNISNATQLDFGGLFPVMYLEPGTIMSFENLVLKGIASKKSPAVTALGLPFAVGFEVFPAVAPLQNTTVIFNNTMIFEYFPSSCSESDLQQVQRNLQSLFGGAGVAGVRTDPPSVWLQGLHSFPVAIKGANGSTIGTMTIVSDKVAFGCLVDPYWSDSNLADHQPVVVNNAPFSSTADGSHASGSGGSTSSSSTLSSGAVAGIVVGAVVFACLLFIMAVFIVRRRRGHKRGAPFFEASTRGNKVEDGIASGYWDAATETSDGSAHKVPVPLAKTGDVQEMHHRLGVASALKVRFGSIEGLEIGQLIGRGAHGRIYKATFRGVPVAVKVVESSIGPDNGADNLEDVSAEAIFLTALAHPNIVRMFRVATIKLQDRSSTDCQLSQRLDLASPLASGDQNNNSNAWLSSSDDQRSSNSKNNQDIFGMISGPGQYETWLVMEFCEKGSLDRALRRRKHFSPLQEKVYRCLLGVLIDVAEGMEFLHYTANIIHGDLKPANVLLKASPDGYGYTAVVADFGLSRMLDATNESSIYRTTSLGTVNYMSPELLVSGRLTRKADSWAFGIIMIEIWTGESAYGTMSPAQIFFSLTQQHRAPACPVECPAEYASIVAGCLCMEPEERWDFGRILRGLKSLRPV